MSNLFLDITSAHITTYGEKAVDGMSPDERQDEERKLVDQYYEEFQKNGLKNLVLMRPS